MKIRKLKFKQLLKLQLIKLKSYEQSIKKTSFNDSINVNLDQILADIKKALKIIFQYHQAKKRILFIGFPYKLELKINHLTNHAAVPFNFNIQGLISNSNVKFLNETKGSSRAWLKSNLKVLVPKLTKKPDLIVLFEHEKDKSVLTESWNAKIPVIVFQSNCSLQNLNDGNLYTVRGNFQSTSSMSDKKNIFFIGLNFLFKNSLVKR
nr:ribosomal protein S2 [Nitzschia ovalis]